MDKKLCDVCRLCLSKDNLVWIFDKRLESSENMKDVIYITTGVEIHMKDLISQKICKQCCEVTIKMFEFRRKSLANDRILREQSKKYLKKIVKRPTDDITNQSSVKNSLTVDPGMKAEAQNPEQESCLVFKVHPTVRDLFKLYPQIKLPTACLKAHITPFVSMPVHQVENYFKERKMDMNRHIQLVSTSKKCKTNITPTSATGDASEYSEITQGASDNNQNGIYSSKNIVPTNSCHEIQATKNTENAHENITSDKKNSENLIRQESHRDKKRKFVETEAAPKNRCIKKPMIVKSVVSTSDISTISLPLTQSVESSPYVSKYICDICNSVENSAKALKRHHRVIHLTCHLCTTRFPSIESKQNHIKNICIIKKRILNNLPYIEVEKIDLNMEIKKKYREAFSSYFENNASKLSTKDPFVIEILSDDDEQPATPMEHVNKENVITDGGASRTTEIVALNAVTKKNCNDDSTSTVSAVVTRQSEGNVYNTVSIVKPDVRISGSKVLDSINSNTTDTKLLKELLSNKSLGFSTDKIIQTDFPTDQLISVNPVNSTVVLRQLKQQLCLYKIPVVFRHVSESLQVSYNYQQILKQPKNLCLWNDLTPIDVAVNVNSDSRTLNQCSVNNVRTNIQPTTSSSNRLGTSNLLLHSPPKFIRINKSSLLNGPNNIITLNPLLNNVLEIPITSSSPLPTLVHSPSISSSMMNSAPIHAPGTKLTPVSSIASSKSHASSEINPSSSSLLSTSPLVNPLSVSSTDSSVPISSPIVNSCVTMDSPITDSNVSIGTIRVKNVWELK